MWAWAQAGVSLPHYSKAQYGSLPHVPTDQAQPGDLLFFHSPISHVTHVPRQRPAGAARRTAVPSSTSASVNWGKVVGVARPG